MKLKTYIILTTLFLSFNVFSSTVADDIEIWPGAGPGSETLTIVEDTVVRTPSMDCDRDWALAKVTVPTLTPIIPDNANGSAVILCPGGGYGYVVYDKEGIDIGEWLNSIGITAFVLKYRLPGDGHENKEYVPLQDVQRAIRYVRANADQWGIDTSKIGVFGASAGGHVATSAAYMYDTVCYDARDYIDSISARPDFMFLIYPVISMQDDIAHLGSRSALLGSSPTQEMKDKFSAEKNVTSAFPPTYMTRAADDYGVVAGNCNRLYQALQDSGVISKLKIFTDGGHGNGICKTAGTDFANWPLFCNEWLYNMGLTNDSVIISHDAGVTDITLDPDPVGNFVFDVDTKHYDVSIPDTISYVTIAVTTTDDNASVSGQGKKKVTSDTLTITVTAQDDTTTNIYTIHFTVFVGIESLDNEVFTVYPNPTDNSFKIELNNSMEEMIELSIYNIQGQIVKRIETIAKGEIITVSDLTSGIYLIEVKTSIGKGFQKLIVK